MKRDYKATTETGTGTLTVKAALPIDAPRKGDTLNVYGHLHTLTADMQPAVDCRYNSALKKYEAIGFLRTETEEKEVVFYADGFSYRRGEWFKKADGSDANGYF